MAAMIVASARASTPLPKNVFVERANAICMTYRMSLRRLSGFAISDLPSVATFFARAHPIAVRFLGRLRRLTPPKADARLYAKFLATLAASNALDVPTITAARHGDSAKVKKLLQRMRDLDALIDIYARRLSLTAC
jgi:hypothetical protein